MIYFTADLHLGHHNRHGNILDYSKRPFPDIVTHDDTLIDNINVVVKKQDILIIVGDFALPGGNGKNVRDCYRLYRDRIHCPDVNLVVGNHDPSKNNGQPCNWLFDIFTTVTQIRKVNKKQSGLDYPIYCCHYKMASFPGRQRGSMQLFGHSHSTTPLECVDNPWDLQMDVGVDGHDYKPWSMEEVLEIMKPKFLARDELIKYFQGQKI